jgi:hypothetical protein
MASRGRVTIGEGPARILYFRGPRRSSRWRTRPPTSCGSRRSSRLALLSCGLYFLAVLVARAGVPPSPASRCRRSAGGSFYARLTTVFVIGAMAPLLMLSDASSPLSARESRRELVAWRTVVAADGAARHRGLSEPPDPGYGGSSDEEVVLWLSRVVRQDINFYRGPS